MTYQETYLTTYPDSYEVAGLAKRLQSMGFRVECLVTIDGRIAYRLGT